MSIAEYVSAPEADPVIAPEPPADGIRLHIGGREKRDGWKILDALPGPDVDFVGSCNDLSFLPDESCSEIYASHVFEHLGYDHELPVALTHVYRVLKPGGRFRVSVPDLEMLCRLFLHPSLDGDGRWSVMRMMFGGRTSEQDVHQSGLTLEFMLAFLGELGFRDIKRVQAFGLFDDSSTLTFGGVPVSLNIEAWK